MFEELVRQFSLEGESALITGGGTGLGFSIARAFVSAGARVVLTGRREDMLASSASQLGPSASYLVHDLTDFDGMERFTRSVTERFGPIGILVNNAGIHLKKPAVETTEAEFLSVLNTHVTSAFLLSRSIAATMLGRRKGSILFMASMTSFIGMPRVSAYSAAKSASLGLVRSLTAEWASDGIRVNALAPGWIETPMLEIALQGDPERRARILARTPMRRFGCPDEVAWAAVFLCSPAAGFINGAVLPVDGGALIGF